MMPPLPADLIHSRGYKPKCEKFLTRPIFSMLTQIHSVRTPDKATKPTNLRLTGFVMWCLQNKNMCILRERLDIFFQLCRGFYNEFMES